MDQQKLFLDTAGHQCPALSIPCPPSSVSIYCWHLPAASLQTLRTFRQQHDWQAVSHLGTSTPVRSLWSEGQTKMTKDLKKPRRPKGLWSLRPSHPPHCLSQECPQAQPLLQVCAASPSMPLQRMEHGEGAFALGLCV